ncbi:MAG: hypothetical protein M5U28_22705 [Sandaracinaceae bacterium]|nr:hypothetical protein [Sandaracinaceae bacterium]
MSARGCLLASLVLSTLGCGAAQPAAEDTPAPQPAGEEPVEAASSDHTDDDGVPQPSEPELSFTVVSGRIVAQAGAVDLGAASAVRLLGALDLCGPVPSPNSDNAYAPGDRRSSSRPWRGGRCPWPCSWRSTSMAIVSPRRSCS